MKLRKKYNVKKGLWFNKTAVYLGRKIFGKAILKKYNATVEKYKPKSKAYIIIANHTDVMDPGYEILSLNQYIRFVSADFLIRKPVSRFFIKTLGGSIIKKHNMPSSYLIDEIKENLKNGIPVAIHAEGRVTPNGETGFVSENTGRLVKESGVSLITYRVTGAYLRKPRWAKSKRTGRVKGGVVNEYSPHYLSSLSPLEITQLIKNDIYVNAFQVQKQERQEFCGENLAENLELLLYMCPKCKNIGTLKSYGDRFFCTCGYDVVYGTDGFFHKNKGELLFNNLLDWDKWQTSQWVDLVKSATGIICSEPFQVVKEIKGINETVISDNATIQLFYDKFRLILQGEIINLPFKEIKIVKLSSRDGLVICTNYKYFFITSQYPRSAEKYEIAWRVLKNNL